jgi:murein DD-endopeptidase MepM/ murein hydrolase activator NlpD
MQRMHFILLLAIAFCCCFCSQKGDDQPEVAISFTSNPRLQATHNEPYVYSFNAESESGSAISYQVDLPEWLSYNETEKTITGTPGWGRLNQTFTISIEASDGTNKVVQRKIIQVTLGEIICDTALSNPELSPYILPFEAGNTFKLSQSYCPSNPNWGHYNWFAYDFDMPIGTPLIASRAGVVIAMRQNQRDGTRVCGEENYVFILHDDGTVANYVHLTLNGVVVAVDQRVEQGDLIGYSGDSGCSAGPHLHLAVFRQRGPYNRQYTLPVNFTNAEGPLNAQNGLIQGGNYTAN